MVILRCAAYKTSGLPVKYGEKYCFADDVSCHKPDEWMMRFEGWYGDGFLFF